MKSPQDMRIIQIDITNACMYRCSNCTRFCGHHKKNFFMDFETFKRAVDSMIGYHGTIGIMGGEPTLHPEFERFVNYLQTKLPNEYKKKNTSLINPQKDFIETVLLENKMYSEVYDYSTGPRETIVGAGLWSAMVPSYKKHYELIQDVFKMQAVNDHGNIMYHSPILINRKDMGIPDNEWYKIRDNCWAQDIWSATITPKGAFFCEIAGALDMLFDGPGGWAIENGWWKRTPEQFGDQLKWCELCGIAMETFTRDANDWIDDVSESMYKKLQEIDSPKLKKEGAINLVKIENGVISEESKCGTKEVRKELFYDSFSSRFNNAKTILFPEKFNLISMITKNNIELYEDWLAAQKKIFDKIIIIVPQSVYDKLKTKSSDTDKIFVVISDNIWGHGFAHAIDKCSNGTPIVYSSSMTKVDSTLINELRKSVINPGTLHIRNNNHHIEQGMFYKNAISFRKIGYDVVSNSNSFDEIAEMWDKNKIIDFALESIKDASVNRIKPDKRYALFGAGNTGQAALEKIRKMGSQAVMFSDSNMKLWNNTINGVKVVSPAELYRRRTEYDQVIISCNFFKQVYDKLTALGFKDKDIVIYE